MTIDVGKSQNAGVPHGLVWADPSLTPLRITIPCEIEIRSPGSPTIRFRNVWVDSAAVGTPHGRGNPPPSCGSPQGAVGESAPAGGCSTTTSPIAGARVRNARLSETTICPTWKVGSIDVLG